MFNLPFFVGIFFVALSIFLLINKTKAKSLIAESKSWPKARGRMLTSKAAKYKAIGTRWDFIANYEYTVNGKSYKNNVTAFYTISNKEEAEALANDFPLGEDIKVFYNPANPRQSVLKMGNGDRTANGEIIFSIVGIAFGLVLMLAGYLGLLDN